MKKNKITKSLLVGSLVSIILIILAYLSQKEIIDINLYLFIFLMGPPLLIGIISKSYAFVYFAIFIYWNLLSIYFNSTMNKYIKIISLLLFVLIHGASAFLFYRYFGF
ncbi:MAG: hypothetical protein KJ593_02795 [Candidatus Omnitrophica bacterium]|nr:hypothetical protein [Candidatus Omnitrophota bacterium]